MDFKDESKIIKGIDISRVTLVSYMYDRNVHKFPGGNCFSMITKESNENGEYVKNSRRILNFNHENLELANFLGLFNFPVQLYDMGSGMAIINDLRIPVELYDTMPCRICISSEIYNSDFIKQHINYLTEEQKDFNKPSAEEYDDAARCLGW